MLNTMIFPNINLPATGRRIRQLRMERNITVAELSEFMGFCDERAVYKWQSGASLPKIDHLYALSIIFQTTMEDIIVDDEEVRLGLYA